jgi:hypothetical protein
MAGDFPRNPHKRVGNVKNDDRELVEPPESILL